MAPFVVVVIQECERMNALLTEVRRSLVELRKGLDGQLNMSEPMEDLAAALAINEVRAARRCVFYWFAVRPMSVPAFPPLTGTRAQPVPQVLVGKVGVVFEPHLVDVVRQPGATREAAQVVVHDP